LFAAGKKTWPERPFQSFVTRSGRIRAQIPFFCDVSKFVKHLPKFVKLWTWYFLIGGPLAFRLFKPIVNDDYHQEHKEF